MALKGYIWFLGQCLREERRRTNFAHLASRALDLGLLGRDSTRGHIFQACGSTQSFLKEYPQHENTISAASPFIPYCMVGQMLNDWITYFSNKHGAYSYPRFRYNWDVQRHILTPYYIQGPGIPSGGGAGDNEFEIVLRLMAQFI